MRGSRTRRLAARALLVALAVACAACSPSDRRPAEVPAAEASRAEEVPRAPESQVEPEPEPDPEPEAERELHPASDPEAALETPRAVFLAEDGPVVVITEVADTEEARARGLMFRESLPEGAGMLFVFPERGRQAFWMKDTLLPLDMIFIDDGGDGGPLRVVGVVHEAEPGSLAPRGVRAPSRWVVEVPGGFARRHGIREGVPVRLEGLR